jgi:hypothetical protein
MFEAKNDPSTEPGPFVVPSSASALFARLDRANQTMVSAEIEKVETIHELCLEFSAVDEDAFGEAAEKLIYRGADGTPAVVEYLSLEVSALLGISPGAGAGLISDVLDCYYRHPMMWQAVRSGTVRWYRACQVISEVNRAGLSYDDAQLVDAQIAGRLPALPPGRATRLLRGLITAADPAKARAREETARDRRHVTLWSQTLEDGPCRELAGTLDAADAFRLDGTLNQLAKVLAADGDDRSLDHRRATALGILADPARAFQLLNGERAPSQERVTVVLHLTDHHLYDPTLIGRLDGHGPLSRQTWIELLGHDRITIRPVVDQTAIAPVDSYEIPDRIRRAVTWRSPVDTFPYGSQPSRRLDLDHTIPYQHTSGAPPGQTRVDNLAPVNRRAHRAKTANRWKLTQHEGGWLEWTSPAGYHYATGPYGTLRGSRTLSAAA